MVHTGTTILWPLRASGDRNFYNHCLVMTVQSHRCMVRHFVINSGGKKRVMITLMATGV